MRLSHDHNFASNFRKIVDEVENYLLLFAKEIQLDRLVTSANMVDRVFEKNSKRSPKPNISKPGKFCYDLYCSLLVKHEFPHISSIG